MISQERVVARFKKLVGKEPTDEQLKEMLSLNGSMEDKLNIVGINLENKSNKDLSVFAVHCCSCGCDGPSNWR